MDDLISRRTALGTVALGAMAVAVASPGRSANAAPTTTTAPPSPVVTTESAPEGLGADGALAALQAGNQRFTDARMQHPDQGADQRLAVSKSQSPFAVILSCSDSRLPPEVIFDQGLGDLFVVRVAGNIVDPALLGSVEYAVGHLGTPLIVVLGHQNCGAVSATLEALETHQEPHGDIAALVAAIKPAVAVAGARGGDLLDNTIRANAEQSRDDILKSEEVGKHVQDGSLRVMTGYYSLDTGVVAFA